MGLFVYYVMVVLEVSSNLVCFDGVCVGNCEVLYESVIDLFVGYFRYSYFGLEVFWCIFMGIYILFFGYSDEYYVRVKYV